MNEQKDSKFKHQRKTNFYFIWKVIIQISKLQVFNCRHSSALWIFRGVGLGQHNFQTAVDSFIQANFWHAYLS